MRPLLDRPWLTAFAAAVLAFVFNALLVRSLVIPAVIGLAWFLITAVGLHRMRQRRREIDELGPLDVSRAMAVWWSIVIGVVVVVALTLTLPSIIRDNYGDELLSYYAAIEQGDVQKAYRSQCAGALARMSQIEFAERLKRQLDDIGAIKSYNPLRGEKAVGHVVVRGERRTVTSLVPVKRENGSWRPCPGDQPLGQLLPPP